ncbi:TauD/TfdA family dioxygenase [Micromonospora antibiotica]|uniref:TauD/TfdA family dioxygenase n=1 Tax=Micromonospora antibiotica TaxID=2807623 RepID=A0ABS3VHL4_9ACTN|nr:TauD/TfdA family dioxygenase [Micromonospora antibiotica]MBO4165106.1 TauD/TfdA family dioxygenase [Micromonospora antibiotica]
MVEIVGGPAAWRGPEIVDSPDWKIELTEPHVAELMAALAAVDRPGVGLRDVTKENFVLPTLAPVLSGVVDELVDGRGFVLVRGVPVERLTERQAELMYWGIGLYVGIPIHQKTEDDLLIHIRDQGVDRNDPLVRGFQTSARLDYHADSSDVVGLLCIRPAMSGGVSTIVSAVAVHDEIVRRRPDLAGALYADWWHDRRSGNGPESFFQCPIFGRNASGKLFAHYGRAYIESAPRGEGVPDLTPTQIEAMDLLDELDNSDEFVLNMNFAPGDIQFLNNYTIMHARTDYQDHPEPERKRDLIRLWLVIDRDLGLPPAFDAGGIVPRAVALAR